MIRTLRHAARHNFRIEDNTWRAIEPHAKEIKLCSSLRLYEEFLRDLKGGASSQAFRLMRKSGLMREWLPALHHWLQQSPQLKDPPKYHFSSYVNAAWGSPKSFWMQLAQNDVHIQRGMYISEHVLLASLMLPMLWSYIIEHYHNGCPIRQLWHDAIYQQCYPIYRDLQIPMRIWDIIHNMFLIYRRIHLHSLFPDNKKIQLNTPQLNYALQLFNLELDKYQQHKPPWLKQMILSLNDQQLGDATQ
jgi:tRNA nucleotidyltransferase/poly(A) polymerase